MKGVYPEIVPGRKIFKTLVTRLFFFTVGMGMQTAYRIDPDVRREIDSLPETFSFLMAVVGGPSMLMLKRDGAFRYLGEKEGFHADVELWFKNIEYAYLVMTGRISVPNAVYHFRQFVRGSLTDAMAIIRVMNITQTLLLPNFISRFYIKEVPPLTLRKLKNRAITYFNVGYGAIRQPFQSSEGGMP
ncbi:MAG TPA: hypothetical protein PKM41_02790 [Deltaproteobacteria bacterium]|nr:hypothetical protein [Deltaproteobacteria bacterium]HOI05831.1 hypothetical protein [Deltaproteobacteria bacterium]